jgi:hypothetical protein
MQRDRETGDHVKRPGQGRHRATTPAQDRYLRLLAIRKSFPNTQRLARGTNVRIGLETIRQRLLEDNLHIRCPDAGPLLTAAHRQARLQFAENHARWNDNEWARVLFSDESRFCLELSDRRVRVIRRPNERYAQCNILGRQPCGSGSVMVWDGVRSTARTDLHVFPRGTMNRTVYVTDILEQYVVPFALFIGDNFIFQHDNARPHSAQSHNYVRVSERSWYCFYAMASKESGP